jgi:hypothetical protein
MASPASAYLDTSLANASFVGSRKKGGLNGQGSVKASRKTIGFSLTPG